jgi:hypothetical protein
MQTISGRSFTAQSFGPTGNRQLHVDITDGHTSHQFDTTLLHPRRREAWPALGMTLLDAEAHRNRAQDRL